LHQWSLRLRPRLVPAADLELAALLMPGKQVKNWKLYHRLRRKGKSKTSAAKIANSKGKRKKKR
jgi:hypothetical protein